MKELKKVPDKLSRKENVLAISKKWKSLKEEEKKLYNE